MLYNSPEPYNSLLRYDGTEARTMPAPRLSPVVSVGARGVAEGGQRPAATAAARTNESGRARTRQASQGKRTWH